MTSSPLAAMSNNDEEEEYTFLDVSSDKSEPIDWRTLNKVTAVRDQGSCGNCWAHATTACMESAHAIVNDIDAVMFSVEQVTDCVYELGCRGGFESDTFDYYKKHDAILDIDYPLNPDLTTVSEIKDRSKGIGCLDKHKPKTGIRDKGHMNVPKNSPDQMKAAVALGPVTVGICAEPRSFMNYSGGIYDNTKCGTDLDHAVLTVGWGTENGQEYWIVKNSWTADWGEEGYIRMAIVNGYGICGIQKDAHYPDTAN